MVEMNEVADTGRAANMQHTNKLNQVLEKSWYGWPVEVLFLMVHTTININWQIFLTTRKVWANVSSGDHGNRQGLLPRKEKPCVFPWPCSGFRILHVPRQNLLVCIIREDRPDVEVLLEEESFQGYTKGFDA